MHHLRKFVDIRICAFIIGALQFSWALIPIIDVKDASLFARELGKLQYETLWISIGISCGTGMIIGALFKWRGMLLTSTKLSIFSFLAGAAPFVRESIWTPVTISMPILSLGCLMLVTREVVLGVQRRVGDCRDRRVPKGIVHG